jgi:hypothetical protein
MRKRIARRAATAAVVIAAATLATGSQAVTAYAGPCTELWMETGMDVELSSSVATVVGDDSGNVSHDYSVRLETTPAGKFVVVTFKDSAGVCRS